MPTCCCGQLQRRVRRALLSVTNRCPLHIDACIQQELQRNTPPVSEATDVFGAGRVFRKYPSTDGSNLHHGNVSMQHREGEGRPVAAVGVHRGVLCRARWDLFIQNIPAGQNQSPNGVLGVSSICLTAMSRLAPASINIWTRASSPAAQAYIRGVIP